LLPGQDFSPPDVCGSVQDNTGYACMMKTLVQEWRKEWSVEPDTTPVELPFGIVTLAGGTSEGEWAPSVASAGSVLDPYILLLDLL
jgi:hypothetical protein